MEISYTIKQWQNKFHNLWILILIFKIHGMSIYYLKGVILKQAKIIEILGFIFS
jgi:hypothetical protein